MLFDASVRENIAFGLPEASRERIEAAARAAGAHDFVAALPDGYDTRVGQRGRSLSGGQRRRARDRAHAAARHADRGARRAHHRARRPCRRARLAAAAARRC